MAVKTAVHNERAPDFRAMFNWGVKITGFSELFLLAGLGAHDANGEIQHPGDPVGQTEHILAELADYLGRSGYTKDDIIRIEFTLTKDVKPELYNDIFGRIIGFFEEVAVKPAAGTLRVVEALAMPGMMVEYEIWAAK